MCSPLVSKNRNECSGEPCVRPFHLTALGSEFEVLSLQAAGCILAPGLASKLKGVEICFAGKDVLLLWNCECLKRIRSRKDVHGANESAFLKDCLCNYKEVGLLRH